MFHGLWKQIPYITGRISFPPKTQLNNKGQLVAGRRDGDFFVLFDAKWCGYPDFFCQDAPCGCRKLVVKNTL